MHYEFNIPPGKDAGWFITALAAARAAGLKSAQDIDDAYNEWCPECKAWKGNGWTRSGDTVWLVLKSEQEADFLSKKTAFKLALEAQDDGVKHGS